MRHSLVTLSRVLVSTNSDANQPAPGCSVSVGTATVRAAARQGFIGQLERALVDPFCDETRSSSVRCVVFLESNRTVDGRRRDAHDRRN